MLINTFVSYFVSLFRATLRSRDICFFVHKKSAVAKASSAFAPTHRVVSIFSSNIPKMREHSLANPRFLGCKYMYIFYSSKIFLGFFAHLLRKKSKKGQKKAKIVSNVDF